MGGFVCTAHRRKNKGFPTLKRTLNLGIEKGRLLKNSRPKGGLIQVICYPTSPETVDITGFFEKFCIAIRTNDYGLMQINKVNHGWLLEQGIDPMTPAGNIEAGVLFLSDYLTAYGDPEMAIMAYNCGPSGAQKLWASGTYHTEHSTKVMDRFDYWTSILEE